jgi:putative glutamine amidotransferase
VKSRPVILITASTQEHLGKFMDFSLRLSQKYSLAILAGGGVPWVLPAVPEKGFIWESVRRCDGVLLTGGADVNPILYCDKLPPCLKRTVQPAAPERDLFELLLLEALFRQSKPLLAICRGQQILNVALGGTLLVDINTQMPQALNHNRPKAESRLVHRLVLAPGSRLATIARGDFMDVNSTHHQAVDRLAQPLRATGLSADGVIEGVELRPEAAGLLPYLLGVQFHPERLYDHSLVHLQIFKDFVRACRAPRPKT